LKAPNPAAKDAADRRKPRADRTGKARQPPFRNSSSADIPPQAHRESGRNALAAARGVSPEQGSLRLCPMLFPQVMRRPHLAGDALISAQRDQARRNWPTRESDAPRQRSVAQSVVEIAISSRVTQVVGKLSTVSSLLEEFFSEECTDLRSVKKSRIPSSHFFHETIKF